MSAQGEALRLAAELSKSHLNHHVNHVAAAELRRSHSKIVDLEESVRILLTVVSERDRIEAQRDALLTVLKELTGHINERFSGGVWDRARAAIKQAEGEKE